MIKNNIKIFQSPSYFTVQKEYMEFFNTQDARNNNFIVISSDLMAINHPTRTERDYFLTVSYTST